MNISMRQGFEISRNKEIFASWELKTKGVTKLSQRENGFENIAYWIAPNGEKFMIYGEDISHSFWVGKHRDTVAQFTEVRSEDRLGDIIGRMITDGWIRVRMDYTDGGYVAQISSNDKNNIASLPQDIKELISNADYGEFSDILVVDSEEILPKEALLKLLDMEDRGEEPIRASIRTASTDQKFLTNEIDFIFNNAKNLDEKIKIYFIFKHIATKSDIDFEAQTILDSKLEEMREFIDRRVIGGMEKIEQSSLSYYHNISTDEINKILNIIIKEDFHA